VACGGRPLWRRAGSPRQRQSLREDANADQPAPGYGVLNARFHASQQWQGWRFKQFLRLNNLLDKDYIGSVIVGDANKRYYEAAPGRNWVLGVSAQYQF
jgi:iron complex outermembrane receptor protein